MTGLHGGDRASKRDSGSLSSLGDISWDRIKLSAVKSETHPGNHGTGRKTNNTKDT